MITRTAAGTRVAPGASRAPQAVVERIRDLVEVSADSDVSLEDVLAVLRTLWTERGPAATPQPEKPT
ncbi:hypothetical protein SAMN06295974_1889 [Plantibacter flavus]|uniref:Uncharacterized protein n=1 Tax=Plantibacter flavus TaxID=150123 RepID=A0A3N2BXI5_9MICO|nr:hypothetical protein EDD42_0026 [Plantibacter flavus]SMG28292.1 hypothetical protein SAMN06295974_1889 [Plantibacter flavus]